ncbi:hypothetical protein [Cryobacterium aureum]|uniref:hypothetical protein n=1 Tax=Cryobacterium aureum TaxID=995037 RepID=UPI00101ADE5F|nr:hypothetical protein [Cryobacterium aureum]
MNRRTSARSKRLRARWAARSTDRAARAPAVPPEGSSAGPDFVLARANEGAEAAGVLPAGAVLGVGLTVFGVADAPPPARTIGSVVVSEGSNGFGARVSAAARPPRVAFGFVGSDGRFCGAEARFCADRAGSGAGVVAGVGASDSVRASTVGLARCDFAVEDGAAGDAAAGDAAAGRALSGLAGRSNPAGRLTAASSAYFFERG